jgi:ligand-binding SRPBCC domain-containing protein
MNRVERAVLIESPPELVFQFHDDPHNLLKILPPYLRVEIVEAPKRLQPGAVLKYAMCVGPLRFDWTGEIVEHDAPSRFVDVQRKGPFRTYRHTHLFAAEGGGTRLTDVIEYELPLGPLAELANRIHFQSRLEEVLEHGQKVTRALLEGTSKSKG